MHHERISSILSRSGTVDEKAKNILDVLIEPESTLTSLELGHGDIGPEGAIALAEALKDPRCTLTSLDLKMEQN